MVNFCLQWLMPLPPLARMLLGWGTTTITSTITAAAAVTAAAAAAAATTTTTTTTTSSTTTTAAAAAALTTTTTTTATTTTDNDDTTPTNAAAAANDFIIWTAHCPFLPEGWLTFPVWEQSVFGYLSAFLWLVSLFDQMQWSTIVVTVAKCEYRLKGENQNSFFSKESIVCFVFFCCCCLLCLWR